jgi:cytoskeletal protein CcmA (bactofilin family)
MTKNIYLMGVIIAPLLLLGATCLNDSGVKEIHGSLNSRSGYTSAEPVVVHGSATLGNINVKKFTVHGTLTVAGSNNKVEGDLLVHGSADLSELVVKGDAEVSGKFKAYKVEVERNLTIKGEPLSSVKVMGDLLVSGATLTLKQDVEVKGMIRFTGAKGEVIVDGTNIQIGKGIKNGELLKTSTRPDVEGPLSF